MFAGSPASSEAQATRFRATRLSGRANKKHPSRGSEGKCFVVQIIKTYWDPDGNRFPWKRGPSRDALKKRFFFRKLLGYPQVN
jgi:hypothetical protein